MFSSLASGFPTFVDNPITDILRQGDRKLFAEALKAEIESFLSQYADFKEDRGLKRITRNRYLPKREIQTGIRPLPVKVPPARDRRPDPSASIHPYYLLTCERPEAWKS